MQACFKGLGDTMAAAIGAALTANQEQMNKALKAAINAQHEKSCPDLILPAQGRHVWHVCMCAHVRARVAFGLRVNCMKP